MPVSNQTWAHARVLREQNALYSALTVFGASKVGRLVAIGMDLIDCRAVKSFAVGGVFWNGRATKRPVTEP